MANTCGGCKYYGEKECSHPEHDGDHNACGSFKPAS